MEKRSINYATLENWKERRNDKRVENHWKDIQSKRKLNSWEKYQQEWNFIETEYSERPSNNGLDLANPNFAFTTNLAKYLVFKTIDIPVEEVYNEDLQSKWRAGNSPPSEADQEPPA